MVVLHPLSDFIDSDRAVSDSSPSYYYEGRCPQSGEALRLPRTSLTEAIAKSLMQHLAKNDCYSHEGKMYGILLVELPDREQRVLKAFSGLLNSRSVVDGWVPPIPGRDRVALEEDRTLAELEAIKQELITLKQLPLTEQYETLFREFEQQLQQISDRHRDGKHQRHRKRQILCETLTGEALTLALEQLDEESRRHGIERRQLKRQVYLFWAIACMDAVPLPVAYICMPGNFASSTRNPDKPSIYKQRRRFDRVFVKLCKNCFLLAWKP